MWHGLLRSSWQSARYRRENSISHRRRTDGINRKGGEDARRRAGDCQGDRKGSKRFFTDQTATGRQRGTKSLPAPEAAWIEARMYVCVCMHVCMYVCILLRTLRCPGSSSESHGGRGPALRLSSWRRRQSLSAGSRFERA